MPYRIPRLPRPVRKTPTRHRNSKRSILPEIRECRGNGAESGNAVSGALQFPFGHKKCTRLGAACFVPPRPFEGHAHVHVEGAVVGRRVMSRRRTVLAPITCSFYELKPAAGRNPAAGVCACMAMHAALRA